MSMEVKMSEINLFYDGEHEKYENCNSNVDDMMFAYTQDVIVLQTRITELSKQLQEANDDCLSLFGYGFHDTDCALAHGGAEYCTCGFDAVCNRHAARVSKL